MLDKQVSDGLKSSGLEELRHLILAYEPVWAIGTGKTASVEQVDEVHRIFKNPAGEKILHRAWQTERENPLRRVG